MASSQFIQEIAVLSKSECESIWDRIQELRSHWIMRSNGFYTLGRNSYQDLWGSDNADRDYYDAAKNTNRILLGNFANLYSVVASIIGQFFSVDATYDHHLALPGLHIWESQSIPRYPRYKAQPHVDLQYKLMRDGDFALVDADAVCTFTLPICIPDEGTGLDIWPDTKRSDLVADVKSRTRRLEKTRIGSPKYIAYAPGTMLIHSGHLLHQIAGTKDPLPKDVRVTLQGHGYYRKGVMYLYW